MKTSKTVQRMISQILCIMLLSTNLQGLAVAGMISTDQIQQTAQAAQHRDSIKALIARSDVRDAMLANGVSAAEVMNRIDGMTDSEIAVVHGQLEDLPAGQGALETILIVFVILILLDLTGVTDIFPRI